VSEDTVFTWYESVSREGFAPAKQTSKPWDEEKGARVVFSEPTQSIFLADMSGDGLTDIVRIRSAEVCYWPNLGYGRFGAKVTMANAPRFDRPDLFDPRRIRLTDIGGSGTTDIIYIGTQGIALYFNQAGNAWSPPRLLTRFPRADDLTSISATDLMGNGTACLVWSSPLASAARHPMRYIDLMGGQKPHLLAHSTNNMGAETNVQYAASTKFYLQDRAAGQPWVTKLPFPVHVIERVESSDAVSNTQLVSTYRYRHGYFDGIEREFRGFAHVEQRDAESVTGEFDLPPVITRTWFHTGALLEEGQLEAYFKDPTHQEYFTGDTQAAFLPDSPMPQGLTFEEVREAARALRGSILRQESYAEDGTPRATAPYTVSERNYTLRCLQPRGPNRHAVFLTRPRETLDYHYERNPADPRISHSITLAIDDYGNMLQSVAIGYQRRTPAFDEQKLTQATLVETAYTNAVQTDYSYRAPLTADNKTFELTSPTLAGATPLDFASIASMAASATEIPYETPPTAGQTQKRLIQAVRTLYRKDDLTALLPSETLESMALPGETYKLALTPGLLDIFQPRATRAQLTAILTGAEGGYRDLNGNGEIWVPSGRVYYSPNPADTAAQELSFARAHFFFPHRFQDPFGNGGTAAYDSKYCLLPVSSTDAAGNQLLAQPDFRVVQLKLLTDPNGNRTEVRLDALGMLVGTVVRGKASGPVEGDSFDNFTIDLTPAQIQAYFTAPDPRALAVSLLGSATTRIIYVLEQVPACAAAIARETHGADLAQNQQTKVQLRFIYSDGFGRIAQTKSLVEPGPLDPNDPKSPLLSTRWVASGAELYNNKGDPVRRYEPFFSATPAFGIEQQGVSSTLFRDTAGRVVATVHPNHTFEKVVFDPWQQTTWDVNDTVLVDPKLDPDIGPLISRMPSTEYSPTWYQQRSSGALGSFEKAAAYKAAKHAGTPTVVTMDVSGRAFLSTADNGLDGGGNPQKYSTRTVLDIEGNPRAVIDAQDRVAARYDYDLLGSRIHQVSMEAGEQWLLSDVTDKPIRAWNSRKYAFRTEYDTLRRPVRRFVQGGDPSESNAAVQLFTKELLFSQTIYGDSPETTLSDAEMRQANLRGKVFQQFDGTGTLTTDLYDFKGNSLRANRRYTSDYHQPPDWSTNPALGEAFNSKTSYDALNRAIAITAPDASLYRPTFNEADLLQKVDVNLRGAQQNGQPVWTSFITDVTYNAKGQRTAIQYTNGAQTLYQYDPETFRLAHVKTTRPPPNNGLESQLFTDPAVVQDLRYTYDAFGNITHIVDGVPVTVFTNNQRIDPANDYTYDPIYRLISAAGREHIGQRAFQLLAPNGDYRDYPFVGNTAPPDPQSLQNYTELYAFDSTGNLNRCSHQAAAGSWTRDYTYDESSLIEPAKKSNRLSQTALLTGSGAPVEPYRFDAHGNIVQMPHLPVMQWDFKDQLTASSRQVVNTGTPETTFYVYDAAGERARKVTERQNGTRKNERFYLGAWEIYREYGPGTAVVTLERTTLHVMDDTRRVALVETTTVDTSNRTTTPLVRQRYQLSNHQGSSSLELDESALLISLEEFSPYGASTFQAGRNAAEVSSRRYRYTGKERDSEPGLTYHGARYTAPWLGIWTAPDPLGVVAGVNLYAYCGENPVNATDEDGRSGTPSLKAYRAANARRPTTPLPDAAVVRLYNRDTHKRTPPKQQKSGQSSPGGSVPGPKSIGQDGNAGGASGSGDKTDKTDSGRSQDGKPTGDPNGTNLTGTGVQKAGGTGTGTGGQGGTAKTAKTEMDYATLLASNFDAPFLGTIMDALLGEPKESVDTGGIPGGHGSAANASANGQAAYAAVNILFTFLSEITQIGKAVLSKFTTVELRTALLARMQTGEIPTAKVQDVISNPVPLTANEMNGANAAMDSLRATGDVKTAGSVGHDIARANQNPIPKAFGDNPIAGPDFIENEGAFQRELKFHFGYATQAQIDAASAQSLADSIKYQQAMKGLVPIRSVTHIYTDAFGTLSGQVGNVRKFVTH
jgi:RHS repeat-associated protein